MIANGQHERDTQKKAFPERKKHQELWNHHFAKQLWNNTQKLTSVLCSAPFEIREKNHWQNVTADKTLINTFTVQASEPQSAQNEDSVLCSNLGFFGWAVRRGEKSEWNKDRGWNTLETAPRLPLSECASVRRKWRDPQPSVEKPPIPTPLIIGGGTTLHSSFHAATQTEPRLIKPYLKFYLF